MSVILITPEGLRREAERLLKYEKDYENEMNQLRQLINSLSTQWSGQAQNAFVMKFNSMENVYREFGEILKNYAELIKKTASLGQSADGDLTRRLKNVRY